MKQYEAVITVMEANGGYATLGQLYQDVLRVPGFEYKTKTPFESIRRIVQTMPQYFFKLKPGLWGLVSWKGRLPEEIAPRKDTKKEVAETGTHTQYQGMIAQMGRWREFETHIPAQDRNRPFGASTLAVHSSLMKIHAFSYGRYVKIASTVDVIWFNRRQMPHAMYEVERTTDFQNSLLKFLELQDFACKFYIVAPSSRFRQFESKFHLDAFYDMRKSKRVRFLDFDSVAESHADAAKQAKRNNV